MMIAPYEHIINQAYKEFNARNANAVLSFMHTDVHWPNGWEGGYLNGQEAVRNYWLRQWKEINPTVQPISYNERENGEIEVTVHQTVKDLQGKELFDGTIKHVYTFENDLIKRMEIEQE